MGLFSSKKSITETTQLTDTTNVSLSDLEDSVGFAGVRDSRIKINFEQSDQGAIDAARDIAIASIDAGNAGFSDTVDFAGGVFSDALNFAENSQSGVFELVEDFGLFGSDLITQQQDFISDAGNRVISSISAIQARESGNTDARLEEITRFALIGAGVVAVAAIAIQLRK